jgi:hypothetical protein
MKTPANEPANDSKTGIHDYTLEIPLHNVPERLQTTLKNYLAFFREYCRAVVGQNVQVNADTTSDNTMRVRIVAANASSAESVRTELPRYVAHVLNTDNNTPEIRRSIRTHEAELFLVLWRRALADVRTDIRFYFGGLSNEEQRALAVILHQLSLQQGAEMLELSESNLTSHLSNLHALKMPSERQELPESLSTPSPVSSLMPSPMLHRTTQTGFIAENPFQTRLQLAALLDAFPNDTTKQEAAAVRIILHDFAANITNSADMKHNQFRLRALQNWFGGLAASGVRAEAMLDDAAETVLRLWKEIDFL